MVELDGEFGGLGGKDIHFLIEESFKSGLCPIYLLNEVLISERFTMSINISISGMRVAANFS